jgi:hypothetical protein
MSETRFPPGNVVPRAEIELGRLLFHVFAAVQDLQALDGSLTPEQAELACQLKEDLNALDGSAHLLGDLIFEMGDFIKLLMRQRQSTKDSFLAGWDGFKQDLLSHLNVEERAKLKPILDGISGSEIPY